MVSVTSSLIRTEKFFKTLGRLQFQDGARWHALPRWAQFYLELGIMLGLQPAVHRSRTVLALAVPSRSYVASLVAAGSILARATLIHKLEPPEDHLAWLSQLAPGTPVLVRENNRRLQGKFQRIVVTNDHTYYMIQIDSGPKTSKGFPANAIQPLDKDDIKLPNNQKGRARQEIAPIVTALLGALADSFTSRTCLDAILVGNVSVFREEMEQQKLAITTGDQRYAAGVIRDLVRPKRFLRDNSAYRSQIISSSSRSVARALSPHLVILDGSLSYLYQHQSWGSSHMVSILDQTEPQFSAAADEINQTYYRRSNAEKASVELPPVPIGVEAMLFEVNP
jgi:hypothetical protein